MIFILIGENDFLIKEKIDSLIKEEKFYTSFKDKDFKENFKKIFNNRLFGGNICLVIKDLDKIDLPEDFLIYFKNKKAVFIYQKKPETLIKKIKELKIPYEIIEIPNLKFKNPKEFEEFLYGYIKENNIKLPKEFLPSLSKVFITNPAILLNELKKIKFYKQNELITKEELLSLIKWPTDSRIFEMVDDFLEKKKTDFILRLNRELSIGTKVEQIIGFLYKTLLRIFLLKKARNIKDEEKLNLNYFYKQKLKMYTKKFNDEEIKRAINYLAEIDRKYKKFLLKEEDVPYEILKILEK